MAVRKGRTTKTAVRSTTRMKKTAVAKKAEVAKKSHPSAKEKAFEYTLEKITNYISERAYYIWEKLGKPEDQEQEIWRQAEKDILSKLIKK